MKNIIALYKILLSICCLFFLTSSGFSQNYTPTEIARWKEEAKNTTIIRDEWGIPHIYGKTDANAVLV